MTGTTLSLDWSRIPGGMLKTGIGFLADSTIGPGASALAGPVLDAIHLEKRTPDTPEAKITLWMNQALALAILDAFEAARKRRSGLILPNTVADSTVPVGALSITQLMHPETLDVWAVAGREVLAHLSEAGVKGEEALEAAGILRDRFLMRLWEVASEQELKGVEPPRPLLPNALKPLHDQAERWITIRDELIAAPRHRENNPLLDGQATLEQIYVPLQGYEHVRPRGAVRDPRTKDLVRQIDLDERLDTWLVEPASDLTQIIAGGPGYGKSSTAAMLAARVAAKPDWRVLFVPLHRLGGSLDWGGIETYLSERYQVTTQMLFDTVQSGQSLLILFDGLDELATRNEDGALPLGGLVHDLSNRANMLGATGRERGGAKPRVRFLLLGRDVAAAEAGRTLGGAERMWHVLPLKPFEDEVERFRWERPDGKGLNIEDENDLEDQNLPDFDLRAEWWNRGALAVSDWPRLPDGILDREDLEEVTSFPVLLALLAFGLRAETISDESLELSKATLYHDVCLAGYRRVWGRDTERPDWGIGDQAAFFRLAEDIALATWRQNTRRASLANVAEILADPTQADLIAADQTGAARRLLMLFFFRESGPPGETKREQPPEKIIFEFTHKSFGDYLLARRLLRAASVAGSLGEWAGLFAEVRVTWDVLDLMREEAGRLVQSGEIPRPAMTEARDRLAGLLTEAAGPGFSLGTLTAENSTMAADQVADTELDLLTTIDAVCRALDQVGDVVRAKIDWPDTWAAWRMIIRQQSRAYSQNEPYYRSAYRGVLGRLIYVMDSAEQRASGSQVKAMDGEKTASLRLDSLDLGGASLHGAHLIGANLTKAQLETARAVDSAVMTITQRAAFGYAPQAHDREPYGDDEDEHES